MKSKPATFNMVDTMHDHLKKRILDPHGNIYLEQLGITSKEGYIKKSKHSKYRQINKYIEIIVFQAWMLKNLLIYKDLKKHT